MKIMIWLGIMVGGAVGGWLGAALDHGNWLGGWSIMLSGVGSLAGIWGAFQLAKRYLG